MSSASDNVTGWLAAGQLVSQLETADAAITIYPVLHSRAQHFNTSLMVHSQRLAQSIAPTLLSSLERQSFFIFTHAVKVGLLSAKSSSN